MSFIIKMTSQIQQTLMNNYKEMEMLIDKQIFNIEDAKLFLKEYHKVIMKVEDLEKSRDLWKNKFDELKEKSE